MRIAFDVVSALSVFTVWWLNNEMNQRPLRSGTRLTLGFFMLMLSLYVGNPDHHKTWHEIAQGSVFFVLLALGAIQAYSGLLIGAVNVLNWAWLKSSESGSSVPVVLSAALRAFFTRIDRNTWLEFLLFGLPFLLCLILVTLSPHFLRGTVPALGWVALAILWAWIVYGYIRKRRPPGSEPETPAL